LAGYGISKMSDGVVGPGGINFMSGPAGSFALNPRDSVLATTNPIHVNEVLTAPAGQLNATIGNQGNQQNQKREKEVDTMHKETISVFKEGFKNLTAATLAPMPLKFAYMNGGILARTMDKIGGGLNWKG